MGTLADIADIRRKAASFPHTCGLLQRLLAEDYSWLPAPVARRARRGHARVFLRLWLRAAAEVRDSLARPRSRADAGIWNVLRGYWLLARVGAAGVLKYSGLPVPARNPASGLARWLYRDRVVRFRATSPEQTPEP